MNTETLKKIIELADGFEWISDTSFYGPDGEPCHISCLSRQDGCIYYGLLLRRAVEGWNEKHPIDCDIIIHSLGLGYGDKDGLCFNKSYEDYQKTEYLTPQEQAIEACLIELLED